MYQAKEKAQKNRSRVAQDKEKLQHQQRQEVSNDSGYQSVGLRATFHCLFHTGCSGTTRREEETGEREDVAGGRS